MAGNCGRRGWTILAGCTIGLDGVVAQQGNYLKSGFQLAYRNIRYQGVQTKQTAPPAGSGHRAPGLPAL
jgi:hypothetical protein